MDFQPSFLQWLGGWVATLYIRLVALTSFVQKWDHPRYLDIRRNKRPAVYAFWHNTQVFLTHAHRNEMIRVIVSQSKDGEYIAQVMKRMGLDPVRGSTSRGGEQALRELIASVQSGAQVGFTPDGPRGPVQTVHGGVVSAATASGAPVVPTAVVSRRKLMFKSWDNFFLPLPFSHIVVAHGEPFILSPQLGLDEAKARVRESLNSITEKAEEVLRGAPSLAESLAGTFLFFLYNAALHGLMPLVAPLMLLKFGLRRSVRYIKERIRFTGTPPAGSPLWFHAASIGEWQALKPILRELKTQFPEGPPLVITVSTPEARDLVAVELPEAVVSLLPTDLPFILRPWIRRLNPRSLLIVETELWPNLIQRLHCLNIPVFILNGRLSARGYRRWRFLKPLAKRILMKLSAVFIRDETDGKRFYELGVPVRRMKVFGNTKWDNLQVIAKESEREKRRQDLFGNTDGFYLIAGSTWHGEEETLLRLYPELNSRPRLRFILAPRRLSRVKEVASLLEKVPASWSFWSKIKHTREWDTDILLVDTLGDLKDLYPACDIAYVGGSLVGRGGQNPMEPAAGRCALLFGPSMENFQLEAQFLLKAGAARQVRTPRDLKEDLQELLQHPSTVQTMGETAAECVVVRQGASRQTARVLVGVFK